MLQNLMVNTVVVNRPTPTKGTSGGQKNTLTAVYSNLPCSIQPMSATWLALYGQRHIETSHTLFFASNPTILIADQIVFGSRTFLVQAIRDLISLQRVLAVDVLEIL